jgi:hypothetical protein
MQRSPKELQQIAKFCIDEWPPQGNATFCNFSVEHVARIFGCRDFTRFDGRPLTANEIVGKLEAGGNWRQVTTHYDDAQTLANAGHLLVAGKKLPGHGHVTWLVPGSMKRSGSYNSMVPLICNVGPAQWHGIHGLSLGYSFANRPKIFIYEPKEN